MAVTSGDRGWPYSTPVPGATPDMPWGDVYPSQPKPPGYYPPKWPFPNYQPTYAKRPGSPGPKYPSTTPWGGGGGGWGSAPAQQGWFGGGGGGGGGGGPAGPAAWQGNIGWGGVPWATWQETPWANVPEKRGAEAQQWFNTMLPWMQTQVQQGQWGQSFDWRKAMDEWNQAFQEGQFGWQKESDVWARGFQEQQLGQQAELEREAQAMGAFGRRWKPQTRWM